MEITHSFKPSLLLPIVLGLLLKVFLESRIGFLKQYVYFNTPLMDMRTLFEAISNYRISGNVEGQKQEYFLDHNAIYQPLLIVKMFHHLYLHFGVNGIKAFLFVIDTLMVWT